MKKLFFLSMILLSSLVFSQEKGSIVGKITDKELNDDPLPFANVLIKGTTVQTTSGSSTVACYLLLLVLIRF